MKFTVVDWKKKKIGEIELEDQIFAAKLKRGAIYDLVKMQLANRRRGTAATKNTALVSGTTAKMYKQKGTGRARHSSFKANIFVGGGTAFGPMPRDYSYSIPKKERKVAMRSLLSAKCAEGKMLVVDDIPLTKIKTKEMAQALAGLGISQGLIVLAGPNDIVQKSVRNIKGMKAIEVEALSAVDLFAYDHVLFLKDALNKVEARLKP